MKIHKDSKLSQIMHIDELLLYLEYKVKRKENVVWFKDVKYYSSEIKSDIEYCYLTLDRVSRSFSAVIKNLPKELSLEILIFYLMCRALDTVEDDINAFGGNKKIRGKYLKKFYKNFDRLDNVGEEKYRDLLKNYNRIGNVFELLRDESKMVIKDVVRRMGRGMSKHLDYKTENISKYNEYCYYVAGLVGEGLSKLFKLNNYENDEFIKYVMSVENVKSNHCVGGIDKSMGLFLQKTNIIRDYLEDLEEGKQWWPDEIWKKYKKNFKDFENDNESKNCISEMVCDALENVEDVLNYHKNIKNEKVFNFCAIPQVMAIATLEKCFENTDIFTGIVKIRKGLALKIMRTSKNMDDMYGWFYFFVEKIKNKIRIDDPNRVKMENTCNNILSVIKCSYTPPLLSTLNKALIIISVCLILSLLVFVTVILYLPMLLKNIIVTIIKNYIFGSIFYITKKILFIK